MPVTADRSTDKVVTEQALDERMTEFGSPFVVIELECAYEVSFVVTENFGQWSSAYRLLRQQAIEVENLWRVSMLAYCFLSDLEPVKNMLQ